MLLVRLYIQIKRAKYTFRGNEIRIECAIGNFEGTIQGDTITGCVSNWVGRPIFAVTRFCKPWSKVESKLNR